VGGRCLAAVTGRRNLPRDCIGAKDRGSRLGAPCTTSNRVLRGNAEALEKLGQVPSEGDSPAGVGFVAIGQTQKVSKSGQLRS
jgi:hypothetical protein